MSLLLVSAAIAQPTATITDFILQRPHGGSDFFIVTKINGVRVKDSFESSREASRWRGPILVARTETHVIPATPVTVWIEGRKYFAQPITSLFFPDYHVSGKVQFTPVPGETYLMNGVLGEDGSAVWIENSRGEVQGQKIRAPD